VSRLKSLPASYDGGVESVWYLEGFVDQSRRLRRAPIHPLPYRIGRHPNQSLTLSSESVSQAHAEIYQVSGLLRIRDLGSTNGTFINRRPVHTDMVLLEGDVVHFAGLEFVVARATRQEFEELLGHTTELDLNLPEPMVEQVRRLRLLIDAAAVDCLFQPILSLSDSSVLGYEMLGQGTIDGLPTRAQDLFNIAASIGAEAELSRLFRLGCVDSCRGLPGRPTVFLNTHPAELNSPGLIESLRQFRARLPELEVVLEIHEVAITEPRMVRRLRSRLSELDIGMAYDDFGTGQARLVDVVEVPPDYLKFDISLIRGIDRLLSKQKMISSLVGMVVDLGITPTAEGIETDEEAQICRELGFQYGQGYLLGRPLKVDDVRRVAS
jgi:EAL domain-containing protein (putative c-di-GMP-specific phosphodiesterase class I)